MSISKFYISLLRAFFMKNKEKPGRKSKVLFDSIDLEILQYLDNEVYDDSQRGISVLDLTKAIGLTHQNLKIHLEKLLRAGLIMAIQNSKSTKIGLISPENYAHLLADLDLPEEAEPFRKKLEDYRILLKFLKLVRGLDFERETLRNINNQLKTKSGFIPLLNEETIEHKKVKKPKK